MGRKRKATEALATSARDLLQHWNEYYTKNDFGIGIQCSHCQKWRISYQYQESKEVPKDWTCSMWQIRKMERGNCSIPSDLTEEDFAIEEYFPGSLVWAKLAGFPWWPAMIEDSPDNQEFSLANENRVEEYHVCFFGRNPKRSWIKAEHIREFDNPPPKTKKFFRRSTTLMESIQQAEEAAKLPIKERLKKYSFAVRYNGRWAKLKNKDAISLPPACPSVRGLAKPAEAKSSATSETPTANKNHLAPRPHITKRMNGTKNKVEMEGASVYAEKNQPSTSLKSPGTNEKKSVKKLANGSRRKVVMKRESEESQPSESQSNEEGTTSQTKNQVDMMKNWLVDENREKSFGYLVVQTTTSSERSISTKRAVVDHLEYTPSHQVHECTGRDGKESIENGGGIEENGASSDDEYSEDYNREVNGEHADREVKGEDSIHEMNGEEQYGYETVNISIPTEPLPDLDDSTISINSADVEVEETPELLLYKELIRNTYPSFFDVLRSRRNGLNCDNGTGVS